MPAFTPQDGRKILYGRRVEVVYGRQGTEGAKIVTESPIGSTVEGHRIDFTTSGGRDGIPHKANIKIYNPPRVDAAALISAGPDGFVSLAAGYNGRASPIFVGVPIREGVHVSRQPDGTLILNIEALSVSEKLLRTRVSVSVAGVVPAASAVDLVASQSGWLVGATSFPDYIRFPRGYSYTGTALNAFRRIAQYTRTTLHVNGGVVEFLLPDEAPAGFDRAVQFSEETGNLLEHPKVTDRGLTFKGMLDASVIPGRQISVVFKDFVSRKLRTRNILVQDRTFHGSTHAIEFHVRGHGREILQ